MNGNIHKAKLSPEVERILSGRPQLLVRWGTLIVAVFILAGLLCWYRGPLKDHKKNISIFPFTKIPDHEKNKQEKTVP
jgi:hypothetical protein